MISVLLRFQSQRNFKLNKEIASVEVLQHYKVLAIIALVILSKRVPSISLLNAFTSKDDLTVHIFSHHNKFLMTGPQ